MKKILIIEDNTEINHLMADALKKAGYECTQAFSGTEALLYYEKDNYDLVLMDMMLPGLCGDELFPKMKAIKDVPVIVVSAKDEMDTKVQMLTSGAEDYITKPFEIPELLARVAVQIRRGITKSGEETPAGQMTYKELSLDESSFTVLVNDQEVQLTKREFQILALLVSHPKRVFTKQDIYDCAWNEIYIGEDKTINVHISNIRKKLKEFTDTEFIETVWGIGYKLAK
ncbi:MAG: response regulator transcription factor [Clostridiales bacterium]|nr:response regulator transcription factor [Clostridiales bacterium]MBR5974109.1 response regulator transcription factor [Clostridiales bacterium]